MQGLPLVLGGAGALVAGTAMQSILENNEVPSLSQQLGLVGTMGLIGGTGVALDSVRVAGRIGAAEARLGNGFIGLATGLVIGAVVGGTLGTINNKKD